MKRTQKIEQFLLTNNGWVFVLLMLIISNAYVLTVIVDGQRLIYLSLEKWMLMLQHFGMFILLFSPMLLLTIWDQQVKNRRGRGAWLLLNGYAFGLHPFLLGYWEMQQYFIHPAFPGELFWVYGVFFLGVRLLLAWQSTSTFLNIFSGRIRTLKLEHLLLLLLPLILIVATLIAQPNDWLEAIWNAVQFILLSLLFYLFYLLNHYFLINKIFKNKGLIQYSIGLTLYF